MKFSIIGFNLPKSLKSAVITACLVVTATCLTAAAQTGTTAQNNPLGLEPPPPPKYRIGTKFIYSDGTWEKVREVGANRVSWINHRKNVSTGVPDFTYKRAKWQTSTRYGFREFTQAQFLLEKPTTTLWPLKPDNKSRYEEFGRWFTEAGIEQRYNLYWSCEVEGTERVSVAAGDFDTWKITCRKYPDKFRTTSKTREYRTWYYAPLINHWVLEERDYNGYRENQRQELVAILPDMATYTTNPEDLTAIQKQFQNALESGKNDETAIWENFSEQLVVGITPQKSFTHSTGAICRQYQMVLAKEGVPYDYPGISCKTGDGRWTVPRR